MLRICICIFFCVNLAVAADLKTFVYGSTDPILILSPFTSTGLLEWKAQQLIFDSLLIEKPGSVDEFRPGLAESWTISKDKKIYSFNLRKAAWADGQSITSADVKFSFESLFDPALKSPWRSAFNGINKIEIIDDKTVRFYAKTPQFELWKNLSVVLRILPAHFYADKKNKDFNKSFLGSGPYEVHHFLAGEKLILQKNPLWWGYQDATVKGWYPFAKIEFVKIANEATAAAYLQKHVIDAFPIANFALARALKSEKESKYFFPIDDVNKTSRLYSKIFLNLNNLQFKNKKIRQALNELVNQDVVCRKLGFLPTAHPIFSPTNALKILIEITGKKSPISFEILYSDLADEAHLALLSESMSKMGIIISTKHVESNQFWKLLSEKKFDAYMDHDDENQGVLSSAWHSKSENNNISFSAVDADIDTLESTFDSAARKKLSLLLRKKINSERPSLVLCNENHTDYLIHRDRQLAARRKGLPFWAWFPLAND